MRKIKKYLLLISFVFLCNLSFGQAKYAFASAGKYGDESHTTYFTNIVNLADYKDCNNNLNTPEFEHSVHCLDKATREFLQKNYGDAKYGFNINVTATGGDPSYDYGKVVYLTTLEDAQKALDKMVAAAKSIEPNGKIVFVRIVK